jgi:hypothetical protein
MATNSTAAIGMLTSATTAPRRIATPPTNSTRTVDHAIKCGAGTPIARKIVAKASGAPGEFGKTVFRETVPDDQAQRNGSPARQPIHLLQWQHFHRGRLEIHFASLLEGTSGRSCCPLPIKTRPHHRGIPGTSPEQPATL